ncbi:MAG: hypothetical protein HKN33_10545 [Pyrinomonadaceae bacterium]|nr:hypothetical protein [Pyrinomonadaceae bacterium]
MKRFHIVVMIVILTAFVSAQTNVKTDSTPEAVTESTPVADVPPTSDNSERLRELEEKMEELQRQIVMLKNLLDEKTPAASTRPAAETLAPRTAKAAVKKVTLPAAKATKDKSDLSFDAGDFRITPYGIIFFNSYINSGGTNNADDPLWAIPATLGNAGASARQTRLGVRVEGGKLGGANVKGVVEADFYGGFPGVGVGEHMGVVRLRLAHVRLDWEKTSLVIGQDWIPFAPNSPTSLAAAAIPQFAAAGNPWSRLPQVRVDHKLGNGFMLQGAILAPGTGDFPAGGATPALLQPGSGAVSRMPFFQGRLSYANGDWMGSGKKGTIGLGTHIGRSRISNPAVTRNVDSYGLAVDWNFWAAKRLSVKGEAFFGENLGGFQAGVFQGYNTSFGAFVMPEGSVGDIKGIRTKGGWIQFGFTVPAFKDRLNLYASTGIDDPFDGDLRNVSGRNFRSQNFGYAFDAIYDISKRFSVGTEFRRLETRYIFGTRDDFNHLNFAARYKF